MLLVPHRREFPDEDVLLVTVACEGLSLKIADHGLAEVVPLVLGVELVMVVGLVTVLVLG